MILKKKNKIKQFFAVIWEQKKKKKQCGLQAKRLKPINKYKKKKGFFFAGWTSWLRPYSSKMLPLTRNILPHEIYAACKIIPLVIFSCLVEKAFLTHDSTKPSKQEYRKFLSAFPPSPLLFLPTPSLLNSVSSCRIFTRLFRFIKTKLKPLNWNR